MTNSQVSGLGGAQGPGELRMLGAQMRGETLFHQFPGGSGGTRSTFVCRGPQPTKPSCCYKEQSIWGHVTIGEAAQASKGTASF